MTRSIVVMCMGGVGHMQVLRPVIEELCARGRRVQVLTHADFRPAVERMGARFVDLFARHPIDAADATSLPVPSRYVSFAGVYARSLINEVAALEPALIVYDTFTLVAPVIARSLGLPYVNVCPNHAAVPARVLAALREDPRVATSPQCWEAVKRLRDVHGIRDAGPFSYVDALSPFLNLYPEPEEFLDSADRAAFEPIAFFGSVAQAPGEPSAVAVFPEPRRRLRIYVSFGTVIWWYFAAAALDALTVLSRVFADLDVDAVISLGEHDLDPAARAVLTLPNVRVVNYADQWAALQAADVFVTHHGINSTHESLFLEVPMISYPFFGDQPALARRCQDLGLAVPLAGTARAPVEPGAVKSALARLHNDRQGFAVRLAKARSWELRTIAGRGLIIDRVLALTEDR